VTGTRAFVQELLSYVAEQRAGIRSRVERGVAASTFTVENRRPVPIRARRVGHRLETALERAPTLEGYVFDGSWVEAARLVRLHGVTISPLERPMTAQLQLFEIDSVATAARPLPGRREASVAGRWKEATRVVPAGTYVVRMATPRDLVAMQLLEPESDDGLLAWNVFDAVLGRGREAPVARLTAPLRLYSPGKKASPVR
jgi:hypothetical protein